MYGFGEPSTREILGEAVDGILQALPVSHVHPGPGFTIIHL